VTPRAARSRAARRFRWAYWLLAPILVAGTGCAKQPGAPGTGSSSVAAPPAGGLQPGQVRVTWLGQSCFFFEEAGGRRLLIDPYGDIGFPLPTVEPDVVLVTHEHFDHNNVAGVSGGPIVVHGLGADAHFGPRLGNDPPIAAGAAEKSVVELSGILAGGSIAVIPGYHDDRQGSERGEDAFFRWQMNGITFCHLGDIGQTAFSQGQRAAMGTVDVLFIPVGGTYTVDAERAALLVAAVKPRFAVPMHYKIPKLKVDLAGVDAFLLGKQFWTAPTNSIVFAKDAQGAVQVVGASAPRTTVPILVFRSPTE